MEFFNKAKAVRLRSHHGKYLFADEDEEKVWQSRNSSSVNARWTVEFVQNNSHLIRLKSCYNKYLTASDEPFVLGTAGKKVMQVMCLSPWEKDTCTEWEPITCGFQVKLRTREQKFLRANRGTPPWRNSVTHDVTRTTVTQDCVLWEVDVVDIMDFESLSNSASFDSSLSKSCSYSDDSTEYDTGSPVVSSDFGNSFPAKSAMEIFQKAKVVRLRSHHDKYLVAEDDKESVCQDRNGSVRNARWTVEVVESTGVLRFQSCYGKYLTASNMPLFLGVTGKKVVQTLPGRLDSSLEWEPIREGIQVKLKTRYGHYLRANGGVPPWRNSVTHDIPHRTSTQDWILWDIDIVEFQKPAPSPSPTQSPPHRPAPLRTTTPAPSRMSAVPAKSPAPVRKPASQPTKIVEKPPSVPTSPTSFSLKSPENEIDDSFTASTAKDEGRQIIYEMVDDKGNVDESRGELSFTFKGSGVDELKQTLKDETGVNDIIVCSRNPLTGKLHPLRLHLPPNNATMHVVVVPSTSSLARGFK